GNPPKRFAWILPFQLAIDGLWVLAEETEEGVAQGRLGLTVVSVFVDRDPIDGFAGLIWPIGIAFVVLHVDAVVKNLTEADRDRFQNAEQPVEQGKAKIRIVNEVVGDAVDVPGNAHRIDEAENEHDPKRRAREKIEHSVEIGAMQNRGCHRDNVPAGISENARIGL